MRNRIVRATVPLSIELALAAQAWGRCCYYSMHEGVADTGAMTVSDQLGNGPDLTTAVTPTTEWTGVSGFYTPISGTSYLGWVADTEAKMAQYRELFAPANGAFIIAAQVYAASEPSNSPDLLEFGYYHPDDGERRSVELTQIATVGQIVGKIGSNDNTMYSKGNLNPNSVTGDTTNHIALVDARADGDLTIQMIQAAAGATTYTPLTATDLSADAGNFSGLFGSRLNHFAAINGRWNDKLGSWSVSTGSVASIRRVWLFSFGDNLPAIGMQAFGEKLLRSNLLPASWMVSQFRELAA